MPRPRGTAIVGVSDHGGWAVLVTVDGNYELLDRRRVELVSDDLPALPHHHEGKKLSSEDAIALVDRVRASAEQYAALALNEVAAAAPLARGIALRACPDLPPTIPERIADYRASNVADWVMYRMAIARAGAARGWDVSWYDPKTVFSDASRALDGEGFDSRFSGMRPAIGSPWNQDHRLAMAAAIAAIASRLR